ncbi:MAG: hypothetical protein ACE5I7_13555 [Candidatus Binatia bacterium]
MARVRIGVPGVAVCVAIGLGLVSSVARAHDDAPPDIAFWGPFDTSTARCQRALSRAVQGCFEHALVAQRHCLNDRMTTGQCDESARDSRVAAAKQAAQSQLEANCTESQLLQLRFGGRDDAKSDLARACADQATAAVSVIYGPVAASGSVATIDEAMGRCVRQTSALGARLLRFVLRLRSRALDRIASRTLTPAERQALLSRVNQRIATARQKVEHLIAGVCPAFNAVYGRDAASFMDVLAPRGDCVVGAGYVQSAITCPEPLCGNGVQEAGEQCDDGNGTNDDLCRNNCTKNDCSVFSSTFALIQSAIFENHGCTNELCHGDARQGNMDLRPGAAYSNIVNAPSQIAANLKRIEPGDSSRSLLWLKLAASTLGRAGVPGSPMPLGLAPLSADELEAVRLWIHAAAPRTGNVGGVAELLDACAVPADPFQVQAPDPPAPGTGVQLHMPPWQLPANSENEVCFASYYDVSDQVPPEFRGADGTTFRFRRQTIVQDPQSHHLIVNLYHGSATIDDPVWGAFTCKGGSLARQPCDPKQLDSCGAEGVCGSEPTSSVACIGYGPPDSQTNFAGLTGTQQTAFEQTFADGVFGEVPLKGIIIYNSHAFNLTRKHAKQEAWVNFYFAPPDQQRYAVRGIFDTSAIFVANVPPFETGEFCNTHLLEQGTRLFQLTSHNHKRGKRFTVFVPDGTPQGKLIFTSTVYNDPLQLILDPPLVFDDPDPATRTLRYCILYDNGATDPSEVKTKSMSPPTPNGFPFGGPCAVPTGCTGGRIGDKCRGNTQAKRDAACDTSPGAGDGVCDACTLRGGATTEDEMFILLGSFYVQK